MWKDQVQAFGETYHAIAYSRRYNFPNTNELRPNHSAAVDAEDLADLMQELNLGKSHIVGFSYGGCSALFLAVKHPELGAILTSPDGLAAPEQERVVPSRCPRCFFPVARVPLHACWWMPNSRHGFHRICGSEPCFRMPLMRCGSSIRRDAATRLYIIAQGWPTAGRPTLGIEQRISGGRAPRLASSGMRPRPPPLRDPLRAPCVA